MNLSKIETQFKTKFLEPVDLFGELKSDNKESELRKIYIKWVKKIHPDLFTDEKDKHIANCAFGKLMNLYFIALSQVKHGTYGLPDVIIKIGKHKYRIVRTITGDLSDVHKPQVTDRLIKVSKSIQLNHFLKNEKKILTEIHATKDKFEELITAHIPKLLESFTIKGHQTNVISRYIKKMVTLQEVRTSFPEGVDGKTLAWMFNRMLAAISIPHHLGYVHGGLVPTNFLICPEDHNGWLIDWCYSVKAGEKLKGIVPTWKSFYPPEVLDKRPVEPQTDVYMAAKCANYLCKDINKLPNKIKSFIDSCLIQSPNRRPNYALELHKEFGEVLNEVYGKPVFHPLNI